VQLAKKGAEQHIKEINDLGGEISTW